MTERKETGKKNSKPVAGSYSTRLNGTMVTAPSRKELAEKLREMRASCR